MLDKKPESIVAASSSSSNGNRRVGHASPARQNESLEYLVQNRNCVHRSPDVCDQRRQPKTIVVLPTIASDWSG
jgi:hypothetical protein